MSSSNAASPPLVKKRKMRKVKRMQADDEEDKDIEEDVDNEDEEEEQTKKQQQPRERSRPKKPPTKRSKPSASSEKEKGKEKEKEKESKVSVRPKKKPPERIKVNCQSIGEGKWEILPKAPKVKPPPAPGEEVKKEKKSKRQTTSSSSSSSSSSGGSSVTTQQFADELKLAGTWVYERCEYPNKNGLRVRVRHVETGNIFPMDAGPFWSIALQHLQLENIKWMGEGRIEQTGTKITVTFTKPKDNSTVPQTNPSSSSSSSSSTSMPVPPAPPVPPSTTHPLAGPPSVAAEAVGPSPFGFPS